MNTSQHAPTDACHGVHCYAHHVDEPDAGAYRVCLECGHAYRTPGELRSAYRRTVLAVPAAGVPWWWRWWRAATARATQIDYCPHCGATL
ncbi:MAG: hypothetical protein IRZ07_26775 [Microbispora sp.]|nr:hypothetical protein [Microbispora sp.]